MTPRFVFCVHNHQPVGNFGFVFADAYERAYEPFVAFLERHPLVRVVLHTSGVLWEWLDAERPAYVERVAALVARGQVEMMTGALYEPILPVIPRADAVEQIEALTRFLRARLRTEPEGAWVAERVWEPSVPSILAAAGVRYTTVDDAHFRRAGCAEPRLGPYYLTEDQGARVAVFPISRELRYRIPYHTPREAFEYLASAPAGSVSVLADDGEKFGVWPETYRQVWENGWLDAFATLLETERDRVETAHFRDVLRDTPPAGVAYLPAAAYVEMMEWALPVSLQETVHALIERCVAGDGPAVDPALVAGASWRSFLMRYPEANRMHHRVHRVRARWDAARAEATATADHGARLDEARTALWRAECNCGYWHGVFGGLYLPHIRGAIHAHLAQAERLLSTGVPRAVRADVDADGAEEVELTAGGARALCDVRGAVVEYAPAGVDANLADVLARRREAYHAHVAGARLRDPDREAETIHGTFVTKELGLERFLGYDAEPRGLFVERLTAPGAADPQALAALATEPVSRGIASTRTRVTRTGSEGEWDVTLRSGDAWSAAFTKRVVLRAADGALRATWDVRERTGALAIESALSVYRGTSPCRLVHVDGAREAVGDAAAGAAFGACAGVEIDDQVRALALRLTWSAADRVVLAPVETVSLSEEGFERVLQGVAVIPVWDRDQASFRVEIALTATPLRD